LTSRSHCRPTSSQPGAFHQRVTLRSPNQASRVIWCHATARRRRGSRFAMRATLTRLAATLGALACGESGPSTGAEGGACYGNGTCNAGMTCLSKLCGVAGPQAGSSADTRPGKPVVPTPTKPTTTAVILDDAEGGAVLACAISDKLVGSAWKCSQEITGDLAVASLGGGSGGPEGPRPSSAIPRARRSARSAQVSPSPAAPRHWGTTCSRSSSSGRRHAPAMRSSGTLDQPWTSLR